MRPSLLALVLALPMACAAENGDIVGPFTGASHRYLVDAFVLPHNNTQARQLGDALDASGAVVNQAGMVIGTLSSQNDLATNASDLVAAGALVSSVIVQADDLDNDPRVGVTYYGADGDPATVMGGRFVAGSFVSNRTRTTRVPGAATFRLPLFPETDPSMFALEAMEIDLVPDGAGGYNALVRGEIVGDYLTTVATGLYAMIVADPTQHLVALDDFGGERGLSIKSIATDSIVQSLLEPDVTLFGKPGLSIGFGIHLSPCASGDCALAAVGDHCHDRAVDADETDVDCGGSTCAPCGAAGTCQVAGDCQSQACDAGACRAPTCSDGVKDGLETDIDCGWTCPGCAAGRSCYSNGDCASGACSGGCRTDANYTTTCTVGVCM